MLRPGRTLVMVLIIAFVFAGSVARAPISAPSARAEASGPNPNSPFGVAGAMRWPDWGTFDRPASAILDTGASWAREDFVWGLIEPRENAFDWTATDRIVANLSQRGISILGIISYGTNWASPAKEDDASSSPVSFYPPDNGKYYWFVRALVARYKAQIHYWEVWNEPNSDTFWKPKPDAHQYADLLKTAYRAVKEADPSAKVVTGGTSGNAVPFLEDLVRFGAGDSFDILGLHPYAVPLNPAQGRIESRPDVHRLVQVELLKYRAFLQRHGYNRPMWITEMGWPAHDWKLDDQTQADYLAQAYAQVLASGLVERVFWYSFKDESASPDQSWGLVGWGGGKTDLAARRASFAAYATSARALAGTTAKGMYRPGQSTVIEGFEGPGAWNRQAGTTGDFTATTEQHYSGSGSARLRYSLSGPNQAVDFAPPQAITLPGKPAEIGVWVKGDASGNYLSAWLRDRDGELFKAMLGSIASGADGWRYYSAHIDSYYFDWERTGGAPANGKVDYPAAFVAFRLENTPDEPAGSGTIYFDDLQVTDGPDVWVARFGRSDGQVVDVVWSANATSVSLPTGSTTAQIIDRDGAARSLTAAGGNLTVQAGSRPSYIVHKPAGSGGSPAYAGAIPSGSNPPTSSCAAAGRTNPLGGANLYFDATGHNLGGPFRAYWESHGGVNLLGYPLTEEFTAPSSDGKQYKQQYFERARMEYHPENPPPYDVQLGLLGAWSISGRTFPRSSQPASGSSFLFFDQTGHSVGVFRDWWARQGGVPVFGLPLSDELQEKSQADGKTYTVQYFERNRLEYHAENKGTEHEVLLGLLGAEYLAKQGCK